MLYELYPCGMPEDLFDIWFRYHVRRYLVWSRDYYGGLEAYAKYINEYPEIVEGVAEGRMEPTDKILEDMGLTYELVQEGRYMAIPGSEEHRELEDVNTEGLEGS
jgi:hypothetical protein